MNGATEATLVHRATAPGVAGIALVDVLGEGAADLLGRHLALRRLEHDGRVRLTRFLDDRRESVDDVVVTPIRAADSWCGLGGWRVSCHGGVAVTERVVATLQSAGARRVGRDELVEIAFRRPDTDGLRAAAYASAIEAPTERGALYFLDIAAGALHDILVEGLREALQRSDPARHLARWLDRLVDAAPRALRLGEPLRVLIAGRPNVGKSTLFNELLGQERVVVSPRPGTTRDAVEELGEIDGYPVILIDSAGYRPGEEADPVEAAGIERAHGVDRDAVLFVTDRDRLVTAAEREWFSSLEAPWRLWVRAKRDLEDPATGPREAQTPARDAGRPDVYVSCERSTGIDDLREAIRSRWLGPPASVAIEPLPFSTPVLRCFVRLRERLATIRRADLDGIRAALIECLGLAADFPDGER